MSLEQIDSFDQLEPLFTPKELALQTKFHPETIRRMFESEPGVNRIANGSRKARHTIRIPASVARRVLGRLTVGGGAA